MINHSANAVNWDASFAIKFFDDTRQYYAECRALETRLENEGIIAASSVFTQNEFALTHAELNNLTLPLDLTATVEDRAYDLMRDYALLPTDAYHVAIALDAGVTAFATPDADFLRCLP
jgi:predicted nucleic acid-binding protein